MAFSFFFLVREIRGNGLRPFLRLDCLTGAFPVEPASVSPPVLADSPALSVLIPPTEGHNKEVERGTAGTSGCDTLPSTFGLCSASPAPSGEALGGSTSMSPCSLSSQLISFKRGVPLSTYLGFCVHNPDLRGVQWNLGTQVVGLLLYRTVPGEPVRPLMEMKGLCKGEVREGTMSTPNASTKYFIMIGY